VGTQVVIEEEEDAYQRVGVNETVEAAFSIVPRFESFVKAFDDIVRDVGSEILDADMNGIRETFSDSDIVSVVVIGNDTARRAERLDRGYNGISRGSGTVREVKAQDKACFGVDNEPKIEFFASDLDNSFVGVPLIGIEVHVRQERERKVLKDGRELNTPLGNRDVT